jgi:hypothetical protein
MATVVYLKKMYLRVLSRHGAGSILFGTSIVALVAITIVNLSFSTKQVTKGYSLAKLQAEQQELIKESEILEMKIADVRSIGYVQNSPKFDRMRQISSLVYISGDNAIASR